MKERKSDFEVPPSSHHVWMKCGGPQRNPTISGGYKNQIRTKPMCVSETPSVVNLLGSFKEQVRLHPTAPALEDGDRTLSYAELLEEAETLAAELRSQQLCGVRIALDLPRSAGFVIAVLAVWSCGSSFVPITELPVERRAFILEESSAAALLGFDASAGFHLSSLPSPHLSCLEEEAWLITTSGSTGRPKGVCVGHAGLLQVISQQIKAFELGPGSRCLWMLSPLFDASQSDIFTALCSGATLVIGTSFETTPEKILNTVAKHRISYLDIPPSLLHLLSPENAPACLLTLGFGGEICSQHTVRKWSRRVRLFNLYGPTEASICCSLIRCGPDWCEGDIGRPLKGAEFRLDPKNSELLIGGPCLALGYWRRPDLDAARFTQIDGHRFYRSGDRVHILPDGRWRFLGRLDQQVKVRGRLVECGEVESAILGLPGVSEAAVFAVGPRLICAYAGQMQEAEIRGALLDSLPTWMIPARFLRHPRLPRTASGKIDFPHLNPGIEKDGPDVSLQTLVETFLGYPLDPGLPLRQQGLDSLGAFELALHLQGNCLDYRPEDLMKDVPLENITSLTPPVSVESCGWPNPNGNPENEDRLPETTSHASEYPLVFLTGASGFLGLALLCELQRSMPASRFLLLQRGSTERLQTMAEQRGLRLDFERLEIIQGDLTLPDLGLSEHSRCKILAAEIFIHAAAELRSNRNLEELTQINVTACHTLARLYIEGTGRRFYFVSSLAVFACSDAPQQSITTDSKPSGHIHGFYAQTKLKAECLLETEIGEDRGLRLIRPALVGGAANRDDLPPNDFLTWLLEALARHPLGPSAVPSGLAIAVAPLEAYSAGLAQIVTGDLPGPIFHLAPRSNLELRQLCEASETLGGRPGLDLDSWRRALEGTPLPAVLNGLFGPRQHTARSQDLFLASGYNFAGSLPPPDQKELLAWLRHAQKPRLGDKVGLVLGKFLPPHRGHLFLVEFARRRVDRLYVVVGTLGAEPIPGEQRFEWMRQLCPDCIVLHLRDENPQHPEEHPEFWDIWERSLKRILPEPVDLVFASESYGTPLAAILGAQFIPCDIPRATIPISGTAVRENPSKNWSFLPAPVQSFYRRRICLFGPESCGKSTLANQLASHFRGTLVPEFARSHLEELGRAPMEIDMLEIANGQIALQRALEKDAAPWLFCDTDALATCIWQEFLFGHPSAELEELAKEAHCEFTLLCNIDLPWVADPVRLLPDERASFLAACITRLNATGRPWRMISGHGEQRLKNAIAAIEEHFSNQRNP